MKALLVSLFFLTISLTAFSQTKYEIVYATNLYGKTTQGDLETLIKYIREGKPVRVGWQVDFNRDRKPDFEHWAPAEFITIFEGHVFTQIRPVFMQNPNKNKKQVQIRNNPTQWNAVVGTNSILLNRYIVDTEGKSDAEKQGLKAMTKVKEWKVATFWSVQL